MRVVVVGSGPAGAACAQGLAARGHQVTVLDAGVRIEPELESVVVRLRETPVGEWAPEDLVSIKGGATVGVSGPEVKLVYGSDFPYRPPVPALPLDSEGVAVTPSHAAGGLSNVWGGALLPYSDRDLEGWPLTATDLAPFYREALALMDVSAVHDYLADEFPLYTDEDSALSPSPQADRLLRRMQSRRDRLRRRGIRFGSARLAVRAASSAAGAGCVYCGMCLHGCPYGLIYNSFDTIERLRQSHDVQYRPGLVVERVVERSGHVEIVAWNAQGERESISTDRVFLAAGAINTTRILLESLELYDQPLRLLDSQYFLLPLVQTSRVHGARDAAAHTLSQVFIEVDDPGVDRRRVHLQVYTFNDLVGTAAESALSRFGLGSGPFADRLLDRLLVIQGYLHSDASSRITVGLRRPQEREGRPILELRPELNRGVGATMRRLALKVLGNAVDLGMVPVVPLLRIGAPGRGFHVGGTFPMASRSGAFGSDTTGRPDGFQRVFIADSTSFPTIPAGPITLSVMANALRVASSFDD